MHLHMFEDFYIIFYIDMFDIKSKNSSVYWKGVIPKGSESKSIKYESLKLNIYRMYTFLGAHGTKCLALEFDFWGIHILHWPGN